jgi:hypothetical protein
MSKRSQYLQPLLALLGVAFLATPAIATSYVMVADPNLADQASLIAEVRIVGSAPSPAETMPATDYLVTIEHLIKGSSTGSSIVVRVPGGVRADGKAIRIWGAPEFKEGDRALLLLAPRNDGTYAILHLMLGAFHIYDADEGTVAIRNLEDAERVIIRTDGSLVPTQEQDPARDLAKFTSWLEDRARGVLRTGDYALQLSAASRKNLDEKYTVFNTNNMAIRWFQFDTGGSVTFFANQGGQPGLAGGGFNEFQIGLQAWNNDPSTPIHYVYGGTTAADGGLTTSDGVNSILFGDPHGEITTPFSCGLGGILAHGGPWYDPTDTGTFNGKRFIRTQEADITTNKGIECFFSKSLNPSKSAQELFGHELGHTLGLGHSCGDANSPPCASSDVENDALMRTFIHNDGRGAEVNADDQAGIRFLYGKGGPATFVCRPNANTLCLLKNRFAVTVSWVNQFNSTSGVGAAIRRSDSTGFFSFGDPSNIELLVKTLDFGSAVKVFYGELTNLNFTITVADGKTGEVKTYSNTPGDCGGIDETGFPGAQALNDTAGASKSAAAVRDRQLVELAATSAPSSTACRASATNLCLLGGRFAVSVKWSNPFDNSSGTGVAGKLSDLVGTFYFTDPSNVELMTKALDFGTHVAFYYGALSDFGYTITVTEVATGKVKTYASTPGVLCGGLDNNAF